MHFYFVISLLCGGFTLAVEFIVYAYVFYLFVFYKSLYFKTTGIVIRNELTKKRGTSSLWGGKARVKRSLFFNFVPE